MVFKPENKFQIIRQSYNFKNIFIDDFQHQPFLSRAKVIVLPSTAVAIGGGGGCVYNIIVPTSAIYVHSKF